MKQLIFSITVNKALMETLVPIFICVVLPVAIVWIISHYRRLATENNVTIFTSLDTVRVLLEVLEETTITVSTIDS